MPSLKSIRKRIGSVKNTRKITRAMKLVAAAKLRRAQDAIIAARPYAAALAQVVGDLAEAAGTDAHPLFEQRPAQKVALSLAALAMVELTVAYGRVPVIALIISASWAFYGLLKRRIPMGTFEGLAGETLLLLPAALAIVALPAPTEREALLAFGEPGSSRYRDTAPA